MGARGLSQRIHRGSLLLGIFGAILIGAAFLISWYIDKTLDEEVEKSAILDGYCDDDYEYWVTNCCDKERHGIEYMRFYLWNITNTEEFLAGEKPVLQEVGPYSYRQYIDRFDVEFYDDNRRVSFKNYIRWIFEPSTSITEDGRQLNDKTDLITTVNAAYAGAVSLVSGERVLYQLDGVIESSALIHTRTTHEHIWGFDDPMLITLQEHPIFGSLVSTTRSEAYHNCTSRAACDNWYGYHHMRTGVDDLDRVRHMTVWDDIHEMGYYPGTEDGPIYVAGSDKKQYKPDFDKKSFPIFTFEDRLMRSYHLQYLSDTTFKGIKLRRYVPQWEVMFGNPKPEFAMDARLGGDTIDGLIDISLIYRNTTGSPVPLFISQPHYYSNDHGGCGDPRLCESVIGMRPNFDKHCTRSDIEPITGKVIAGRRRAQVNLYIEPALYAPLTNCDNRPDCNVTEFRYRNIEEVYMPFFWFEESGEATDDSADYFKSNVYFYQDLSHWLFVSLVIVGSLGMLVSGFLLHHYAFHNEDSSSFQAPLLNSDDDDGDSDSTPLRGPV
eukprot:Rmarinus@m.25929